MKQFSLAPEDTRSHYQRMVDGDWYIADGSEIQQAQAHAVRTTARFDAQYADDPAAAQLVLSQLLGALGEGTHVRAPLAVDYGRNLFIGAATFINCGLVALDVAPIRIGDHCQFGPNVQLLTPTHPIEPAPRREGWESAEPITIEDNVWIGGGVIVCPGVTIGRDSVIGAGAVVTKDVSPGVVAAGNPARVLREL